MRSRTSAALSTQRARAIQADLLSQLRLAREVVATAYDARRLPALDQLCYRIDQHIEQIRDHLAAGDEVGVVTFLRAEVETLLDRLATFGDAVAARVTAYREALDAKLGAVYRQRKIFEDSVTRMNETISSYLELEEQAAQSIFPHYFEKQKTDGVDHQVYVGGSLVEDGGLRSALPQEPAPGSSWWCAASQPGPTASPRSFHSRCRPRTWCWCSTAPAVDPVPLRREALRRRRRVRHPRPRS